MAEAIAPVVHGEDRRSYAISVGLHALGATASAALFGALLGIAGMALGAPWGTAGVTALLLVALLYGAREGAGLPIPIPDRKRQVPDWWRSFYSPAVASLLYGLGLGVGFLTYLTFGTFVAVAAAAVISGDPATAALLCAPFGLARGLSVLVSARSRSGEAELVIERLESLATTAGPRIANALALGVLAAAAVVVLV
jgi:hypothetical protein